MRIIYVYDALCGWCYGFSPVIRQLYDTLGHRAEFDVLSGGMMTGSRVQPISVSMSYIEQAYRTVEQQTGVRFGEAYLTNILRPGTFLSNSEKPGMAMTLFKAILPERAVEFAGTIQNALYQDGIDINIDANYAALVEPYDIDPGEFVAHISDEPIRLQTQGEFKLVSDYGINGFPAVIVDTGEKMYQVARGYLPYDALMANVSRAMEEG